MSDDPILTEEHVTDIRTAHRTVMHEIKQMKGVSEFGPPEYYNRRLAELCPAEALQAWNPFRADRRETAKRIDPLTCSWQVTFTDILDSYGISGAGGCIGRDF